MLDFLSPPKIVSDARDALRLFILLSNEKNESRSAAVFINPSVLADTSPIFCSTKHRGGGGDVFFCLNFGEMRHNGRRDCVFLFRDMRVISSIV